MFQLLTITGWLQVIKLLTFLQLTTMLILVMAFGTTMIILFKMIYSLKDIGLNSVLLMIIMVFMMKVFLLTTAFSINMEANFTCTQRMKVLLVQL